MSGYRTALLRAAGFIAAVLLVLAALPVSARSADANRLLPSGTDMVLDGQAANRVVQLQAAVPSASMVDAAVATAAEAVGSDGHVVEILTSDTGDFRALAAHVTARLDIRRPQ